MEDLLANIPEDLVQFAVLLDVAFFLLLGKAAVARGTDDASE